MWVQVLREVRGGRDEFSEVRGRYGDVTLKLGLGEGTGDPRQGKQSEQMHRALRAHGFLGAAGSVLGMWQAWWEVSRSHCEDCAARLGVWPLFQG